jgi:hypothetical protein
MNLNRMEAMLKISSQPVKIGNDQFIVSNLSTASKFTAI